ncbi:MAG: Kelch repeat-containing protein, partial [Thermoanaerobaculia bacterium]
GRPNPNNPASLTDTGGRYDPNTDTWNPTPMPTSASGAPTPRRSHTAITDLSTMTVWGGISGTGPENTGARYDPQSNTWVATPTSGAPVGRSLHSAIVTESGDMIVWGGESPAFERTGAILRSADNTWVPLSIQGAPSARSRHTAVWTGGRMIIWGGENLAGRLDTGGQWGFLSVYRKN